VHDKQVRRRRAVLVALVAVSLILLTAYFGAPQSSPLHTLQRGIVQVLSPIQEGASKVVTPFRDVAGWFSDTIHSKSRADQLEKQVNSLRAQLAQAQSAEMLNSQAAKQVGLDQSNTIGAYKKLSASVISHDATLWYETIEVDKGSDDGVRLNAPVVWEGALVGKVSAVGSTYSEVTLITDHTFAAAAQVQDQNGDAGVLEPRVGNPNQLVLKDLPTINPGQPGPSVGQQVVTLGFKNGALQDLYPAGIPIGQISDANQNNLYNNHQVIVSPVADLRHLYAVQILIKPNAGTARAQVPSG
jgi:rod shape-determining protein MreC